MIIFASHCVHNERKMAQQDGLFVEYLFSRPISFLTSRWLARRGGLIVSALVNKQAERNLAKFKPS